MDGQPCFEDESDASPNAAGQLIRHSLVGSIQERQACAAGIARAFPWRTRVRTSDIREQAVHFYLTICKSVMCKGGEGVIRPIRTGNRSSQPLISSQSRDGEYRYVRVPWPWCVASDTW